MIDKQLLETVSELSHEFGTAAYVRGGGGNTSCKNETDLYIKPSGLTLGEMTPERFIGLSRDMIERMFQEPFSNDAAEREAQVVAYMAETLLPGSKGRPSVEAPLHNCFPQRFVIHTHPAIVNGMTCGRNGARACGELFPQALWLPPDDPGYQTSKRVRAALEKYAAEKGNYPEMLFLANHGLFIAHDDAEGVRRLYRQAVEKISEVVSRAGKAGDPARGAMPAPDVVERTVAVFREIIGSEASCFVSSGRFALPAGALSPDHIVYCKAALYEGDASPDSLRVFKEKHGYWPRVIATPDAVYGIGSSQKVADLALELAWDGALVVRYAEAFGGAVYLEQRLVDFIENWEVESYRQRMAR